MSEKQIQDGWRIKLGFALFIMSIGWPVLLPIMPLVGFSGSHIAAFSGAMLVVAEIMILAGVAIVGKNGFALIKSTVFRFLRSYGPPIRVGRARYRVGILMFVLPLFGSWALPYFGGYLPGLEEKPLTYAIAGDALLVTSLFVLGGEFWDKLGSLFIYRAYAVIPDEDST